MGSCRGESIVSAVVRGESAKLSQSRRWRAQCYPTSSPAVVIFARSLRANWSRWYERRCRNFLPVATPAVNSRHAAKPPHLFARRWRDDDRGGAGGMSIAPPATRLLSFALSPRTTALYYGLSSAGTMTWFSSPGPALSMHRPGNSTGTTPWDARNFFNPAPQPVAELRLNTFGFNVGGPVTARGNCYNRSAKKTFFFL